MSEALTREQRHRVERGKPLVDKLARSLVVRLSRISEDELRSAGYEALVKCGLRYDPAHSVSFRSYSFHRVRGAMIDAARRATPGVRRRTRALRTMQASQALLEQLEHREASDGPDPRTLRERVDAAAEIVALATATVVLSHIGGPDPEDMADEEIEGPEALIHDAQLREHVRSTLARHCTDDERALLTAIYDRGLSMTELGAQAGCSKSTISRRHAALLQRLARELRFDPDTS